MKQGRYSRRLLRPLCIGEESTGDWRYGANSSNLNCLPVTDMGNMLEENILSGGLRKS